MSARLAPSERARLDADLLNAETETIAGARSIMTIVRGVPVCDARAQSLGGHRE